MRYPIVVCIILIPLMIAGQSHNYWTRSFNEESSLLSGAVVGGGAGPAAIYYNPSSIAEISESKFSLHASLFSLEFMNVKNALGDGIDLQSSKGKIEPRFISYMIQPKKYPNWSFELAFLNNMNYSVENTQSIDHRIDILKDLPGIERYHAFFQFSNTYRDDWLGIGGSWKLNPRLFFGASMFVSIRTLEYRYLLDIEAFPMDSVFMGDGYIPFYSAHYYEMDYLKYNDYRLLWKFGLLYKRENYSVGFNLTTTSVGGIYSDGKKASRKLKRANITNPETGEPLSDYVVVDFKEKNDVFVNDKSPLSIAAGFTYYFKKKSQVLYTTVEYFSGIDPYRLAQAEENPDLLSGSVFEDLNYTEWLTTVSGAKPVFNGAIGYKWQVKENFMIMAGFRTDFNYLKNYDYENFAEEKIMKDLVLDLHHLSYGLAWRIRGQDLMTGFQYTIGRSKNQAQFNNLSEPVEYNFVENEPLQGTRQNNMQAFFNSLSLYFGATFNFGN